MKQILGYFLIASPFAGLAGLSYSLIGPIQTILVFGATAAIMGTVCAGVWLANS